ncbi:MULTISPECIES: chromosome segregation protein SMC [unclassified Vagococcus]|uniref:chromosome segregation protein SMC n=1 Tax=unclassified Vagococcus TaxID=2648499 RepID=UPI001F508931|nr:chromosome segregation protein SMC [Vagococcus sp. CY52-2]MCI0131060.1 chromosome segregation protein SMC [Vagococcus sp. CY53-2]UNM89368.1 chromosome segregation protein SMC [Vagococcus sp. CY52-2]
MYLKRIEIAGFKSFAERTIIEFNEGLTAVVGPNGSGKSNITEAVRWVLGEQSAKNLRGGKMPDVIFAGSSSRSPLNIAEVTLVLDNEDHFLPIEYSEVSVTRRLTRDGESDFFINKQRCRLKDVISLFMDSGLGRDSFSIISQGKVEEIFNSKPEERRAIFEEAAGVLKYKNRKKQAEKHLGETDDNLSRVQDIIYELEIQLAPLKKQSDNATQYLALKETLSEQDISMTTHLIEETKEKWEKNKEQLRQKKQALEARELEKITLEETLEQLKLEQETLEQMLDNHQQRLLDYSTQYEQLETQKRVLEEKQKFSVQTKESQQKTLRDLDTQKELLRREIDTLKQDEQELIQEKQAIQKDTYRMREELVQYSKSAKEQLDDMRSDYLEYMQQQSHVNNELKHLEKQYSQETNKNSREINHYEQLISLIKEKQETLENLEKEYDIKKANVVTYLEDYQQKRQVKEQLNTQLQKLNTQLMDALRILQQAQAKQKSLKELQDNYAGFYQGVRAVLKDKQQFPGVVGAVAELIEIPEAYQLALETALGTSVQHIVTTDDQSAREAISYLKKQRLGRATFLPLTTVKARFIRQDVLDKVSHMSGFIGVASELVSYDETVAAIMKNLLGLTIVADSLDSATHIAKQIKFQYRVVSLDGDVMNPGGSMTGGMSKNGQSMHWFSQSKELQEIEKQLSQMTTLYQQKEAEVSHIKEELVVVDESLEQLRQLGEEARLTEQQLSTQVSLLTQDVSQLEKEKKVIEYEQSELNQFLTLYQQDKENYELEQKELEKKIAELDKKMADVDQLEATNLEKKEELTQSLAKKEAELAVVKEKLSQLNEKQKERIERLDVADKKMSDMLQETQSNEQDSSHFHEEEARIIKEMGSVSNKREEILTQITEAKTQREHYTTSIKEQEKIVEKNRQDIQVLISQRTELDIIQGTCDNQLDSLLTYLQEEYSLTFEAAKERSFIIENVASVSQNIRELKRKVADLGPVNISAIAQHDDILERYDFLTSQRDDLNLAKDELKETMDEMDMLVMKQFHEVFCDIREEFRQVFPKMFGGGHADLILSDETDLLHTGIDIVAQPPGKKLQQLSLLSGGERALTAIALLFSIIQARPIPFCILDEVEAALDEANVTRFGNYLRHFGDATQFIVITHRKGTMESAKVLYGVTMQESGVSKIVSVHLEEMEKLETTLK